MIQLTLFSIYVIDIVLLKIPGVHDKNIHTKKLSKFTDDKKLRK